MSTFEKTISRQWQDSTNFVLGVWLIISPWVFQYPTAIPAWNAWVVGAVIAVAAAAALMAFHEWEEWVNTALGAWLVVSPWILGFSELTTALLNQIVIGLLVGALAIWSANIEHKPAAT
jgi:hypothetical protein